MKQKDKIENVIIVITGSYLILKKLLRNNKQINNEKVYLKTSEN